MSKTKLTTELVENLCKAIEGGLSNADACSLCGICQDSLYKYLNMADTNPLAAELAEGIKKARTIDKQWHINNIREKAKTSWQASAWWLERRYSKEFGRSVLVETNDDARDNHNSVFDKMKAAIAKEKDE